MLKNFNSYKVVKKIINIITFRDIPLQKKFLLFSIGSLFWLMIVAGIGLTFMFYMDSNSKKMVQVNVPHSKTLNLLLSNVREICVAVHKIIIIEDKKIAKKYYEKAVLRLKENKDYLNTLISGGKIIHVSSMNQSNSFEFMVHPVRNAEQIKLISSISKQIDSLDLIINDLWDLKNKPHLNNDIKEKLIEYDYLVIQIEKNLLDLLNIMDREWDSFSNYMSVRIKLAIVLMSIVLVVVLILYFVFGSLISKALRKPINDIIHQLRALSTGEIDLSKKLEVTSKDELGELSMEFNKLMDTLSHVAQFKR